MIAQTISHFHFLEKPPTAFLRNGTSPGQVGEWDFGFVCRHTAARCAKSRGSTNSAKSSHVIV